MTELGQGTEADRRGARQPSKINAALGLLDREMPAGYTDEWADHLASPLTTSERNTHSAVVFRLGVEWFALPTQAVEEAAELRPIHSLPHRSDAMILGLVNVRGELLICLSLARMLGLEETVPMMLQAQNARHRRLIVVRHESGPVAMPVEEVHGTVRHAMRDIGRLPATLRQSATNYATGVLRWGERSIGYLDPQRLVAAVNLAGTAP